MKYRVEASIIGGIMRLIWGIIVRFFLFEWVKQLGLEWTFGMIAVLNALCFIPVLVLFLKGNWIRTFSVERVSRSEAGKWVGEHKRN